MTGQHVSPIVSFYRDPAQDTPRREPSSRYLILTSPRTGSSWLAAALTATGEAGVPNEYLHPGVIGAFCEWAGRSFNPNRFFTELAPRRTTPNGVFGLKLLAGQTLFLLEAGAERERFIDATLPFFDRVIYLYRRDKIAQALSFYVSVATQIFQTPTAGRRDQLRAAKRELTYDPSAIAQRLQRIVQEDAQCRALIEGRGLAPLTVAYEDLLAEPAGEFGRIFDFLGVSADPSGIEAPTYKARDAELEAQTEAFRRWLNGRD